MYEWSFSLYGYVFIGRTWEEFIDLYNTIVRELELDINRRIIIYVHNLSYEFQFIRKKFEWERVFSLDERRPVQAVTVDGVEFRCSYLLSGYKLATCAKNLQTYKISKMVGDLDYNLIRHSNTPLTDKELGYCINDVQIVVAYIQELIEREGNITYLPLTKTGFVRKYCRDMCLYDGNHKKNTLKFKKYNSIISKLTLNKDDFELLQAAYSGGFTHANPAYVGRVVNNVDSFDLCSAYPAVMAYEKFPMSPPKQVQPKSKDELSKLLDSYCCMFIVEFEDIEATFLPENYISAARCMTLKGATESNGRVVRASNIKMAVTEQDYRIIERTYKWKNAKISNFNIFVKDYLPRDFVLAILQLYHEKTTLKNVEGKEAEYMLSKENANSAYGMCVTNPCRDDIIYDTEWRSEEVDIEKSLSKYNKSKKRFLYYPWGIWVCAYNRTNLWSAILSCGEDYVYSDTDSVKAKNGDKHRAYFDAFNELVRRKTDLAFKRNGIDISLSTPKTIEGKIKVLGSWEWEGRYDKFKTLGAKRYMVQKGNKISITVSGVNKQIAVPYLLKTYGDNVFKAFNNELYIPKEYTGKMIHTYIDEEQSDIVTDYLGNSCYCHEDSSVHLSGADYTLSMAQKFLDFLRGERNIKI